MKISVDFTVRWRELRYSTFASFAILQFEQQQQCCEWLGHCIITAHQRAICHCFVGRIHVYTEFVHFAAVSTAFLHKCRTNKGRRECFPLRFWWGECDCEVFDVGTNLNKSKWFLANRCTSRRSQTETENESPGRKGGEKCHNFNATNQTVTTNVIDIDRIFCTGTECGRHHWSETAVYRSQIETSDTRQGMRST